MDVQLLIVPYDSGHRGARMGAGPDRLVESGVESALAESGCQVAVTLIELDSAQWTAEISTAFELIRRVAMAITASPSALPVILCGNCITTLGAVAAHSASPVGIVWFDAHGDLNSPDTTTSGFLDGTALSTITGQSWRELARGVPGFHPVADDRVVLVGARDLDQAEKKILASSRVTLVPRAGLRSDLPVAIQSLAGRVDRVHVHIDLDVLDAAVARANSYAVGGGLTLEDMEFALTTIGRRLPIAGVTLSAYDPAGDTDGRAARAAIRLISAALDAAIASPERGSNRAQV
jgi:arginase